MEQREWISKENTELCERRLKKPFYLVNIKKYIFTQEYCKVHECSYLEATIGDAFHLSSGIMHSFSPDAPGVIIDGLQPQQTCIGKLERHKVC